MTRRMVGSALLMLMLPLSTGIAAGSPDAAGEPRFLSMAFVERPAPDAARRYTTSVPAAVVNVEPDGTLRYGLAPAPGEQGASLLAEHPVDACALAPGGRERMPTTVSRLGAPGGDEIACATYGRVELGEAWPGIAISVRSDGARVEKLFTLEAGADPAAIRMAVRGARRLSISDAGDLLVLADSGSLGMSAPIAFQDIDGARVPVEVAYRVEGLGYGFDLGAHDRAHPVVIDPFLQATLYGGSMGDTIEAMAIHPATGDVYVAGSSVSSDLPAVAGGAFSAYTLGRDGFIARFSADLTTLIQATYFAAPTSNRDEVLMSIGIHPGNGDIYVGGNGRFTPPALTGGAQTFHGGFWISRLPPSLFTVTQSTSLGTSFSQECSPFRLAFLPGAAGDVLVAGRIVAGGYAPLTGGAQGTHGDAGGYDGFVLRLNEGLTAFTGGTYLGSDGVDEIHGLGVHPVNGDVYVAGSTQLATSFPAAAGGFQSAPSGPADTFVVRLNPALTMIVAGTLLGGPGREDMTVSTTPTGGLAFHPGGDVYVMGQARDDGLPGSATGAIPTYQGLNGDDVFVARLSADLASVVRSTYWSPVGGAERGTEIVVDPVGDDVWIAGWTQSMNPLPSSTGAPQPMNAGPIESAFEGFVSRISGDLTSVKMSTYVGGAKYDDLRAMARHPVTGEIYVAGLSQSDTGFPMTAGGADATFAGFEEGWIMRLTLVPPPCPGDCDGNGTVVGAEIMTASRIASGAQPLADCPEADSDASGTVSIVDVVRALIAAIMGCP